MTARRSNVALVLALAAACFVPSTAAWQAYDEPPRFTATELLGASALKGAHYTIAQPVRTEQFFHAFTIDSTYGQFEALGRSELAVRIHEIAALSSLEDVSKTEVFLSAAGQSVVNVGKGAVAAVKDPEATAKGIGSGIKRVGVNLGRRAQRATESSGGEAGADEGSSAGRAANSVLGVNAAVRRWAQKVGADPYTTNAVLRKALEDVAKVDVAGSIATKVVVPIPGVVGMTSSVGNLVWGKDPEEVRKINEAGLRAIKVRDEVAKALFGNGWMTLTYQTRLVAALQAVNVAGVADYVETASLARSEREALFFVESAEMLQAAHAKHPARRVLTDSRAMIAVSADGVGRALLPLDWIPWTADVHKTLMQIAQRTKQELGATTLTIESPARASERARIELPKLGWAFTAANKR